MSPLFNAIYYAYWAALTYGLYWSYSSGWNWVVLGLVLVYVRKAWAQLIRPTPIARGELFLDQSELSPDLFFEDDLTKWHLRTERGRQTWVYDSQEKGDALNFVDKYFMGLDISKDVPNYPKPRTVEASLKNAVTFYSKLQMEDGHWGNDYGGPMFLLPGIVITCHISKTELSLPHRIQIIRYLSKHQREDGGWGLHIEGVSTMFGTAMNYVCMRLLGVPRADPRMCIAREWMDERGGAVSVPAWGKFWLACLNVYDWEGINPVPPELWILPYSLFFHPGRWWCHCRVVYLPMATMYGLREKIARAPTQIEQELREELYVHKYESIDWEYHKNNISQDEAYKGHSVVVDVAFSILSLYEKVRIPYFRNLALKTAIDHLRYEDEQTHGICIGPVNKAMDMLVAFYADGPESPEFKLHQDRVFDYLWLGRDGMKMQGYNGCQLWDTAFALQALSASGLAESVPAVKKACVLGYNYIDISQVRENNPDREKYFRHISKGAWPFSTVDHGWPISDCTAEGFKCALNLPYDVKACAPLAISDERLFDSVNVMLSYQNADGGWPSYENQRGPALLEHLNPADVFDKIMVDYSYTECSSACMGALREFRAKYPHHRKKEITEALARGTDFLISKQKANGGWHGCWGVCYTYAGWFALNCLSDMLSLGIGDSVRIKKALRLGFNFLLKRQHADGSWGEDFRSCVEIRYVDLPQGHVVNTAWAVLSLMRMEKPNVSAIEAGINWLRSMQLPNGDWEQTTISGVFNFNCAISYESYKNVFPIWAMGVYVNEFLPSLRD
eukprot:TRINITY_DN150_c3_g1_i1.p1 TRINITY_DN150_c3_g1~~TRINITY_DN150_c3_g1_i1.p1  ORF type:complete len:801 (-),score=149.28 TRINITY_DN150_c3_g1_i1:66-2429(-)